MSTLLYRERTSKREATSRRGFTLVEVVIAMGIIAVVFTAMMGVIPVALQGYHASINNALKANIISQVGSELLRAPSGTVSSSLVGHTSYFNDEGQSVTTVSQALFKVVVKSVGMPSGTTGGATVDSISNPALVPVTLDIYIVQGSLSTLLAESTIFLNSSDI